MKKLIVLLMVATLALQSACEQSSSDSLALQSSVDRCGGTQPAKTLPWLKNEIEKLSSSPFCYSIARSTYKNETVFILSNCDPNVNSIPFLFDCDGNKLNLTTDDYQNLKFTGAIELIWKNR